jgi:hypothetical protein
VPVPPTEEARVNWEKVQEVAKWTMAGCVLALIVIGAVSYVQNH